MLESYGSKPRVDQNPLASLFKTASVLRIGAGLVLLTRHAWEASLKAYQFVWKELPWDWVPIFVEQGVPMAHLAAPTTAAILIVVSFSWITGFLTRFSAALMIALCATALGFASTDYGAFSELCWLYLLTAFTLTLFGSGAISLDQLFRIGSRWGKKSPNRY
jgi:uncharacterized membrane protein YphA (DoxX/SURF4 family)